MSRLLVLLLSLISFYSVAYDYTVRLDDFQRNTFSLSSEKFTSDKVRQSLSVISGGQSEDVDFEIERIDLSDWFKVTVDAKNYVVDSEAKYWLRSDLDNLFEIDSGINKIEVSNSERELLMDFAYFASFALDQFLVIQSDVVNPTRRIFVFVDLTCPHCKDFHLRDVKRLTDQGAQFVYVPFLRNYEDKKSRQIMMSAFCLGGNDAKRIRVDSIFISNLKDVKSEISETEECELMQKIIVDYTSTLGFKFNLKGSPMFLTETGNVYYGTPSLMSGEFN